MRVLIALLAVAQTLTAASQALAPAPQASAPVAAGQNAGQTYDHIEWAYQCRWLRMGTPNLRRRQSHRPPPQ